jgi:putative oxidoreductase
MRAERPTPAWASRLPDLAFAALRLVSGLMLVQHGVQKHFGLLLRPGREFGGAPELFSQMWIAGTLEISGGFLLALGLFTRPVAFVLSGLMAAAYFLSHAPRGFWPILNGGELAALNCFVFLTFAVIGGGRYSLDGHLGRRRGRRP